MFSHNTEIYSLDSFPVNGEGVGSHRHFEILNIKCNLLLRQSHQGLSVGETAIIGGHLFVGQDGHRRGA